jgi:hypothetical protein
MILKVKAKILPQSTALIYNYTSFQQVAGALIQLPSAEF